MATYSAPLQPPFELIVLTNDPSGITGLNNSASLLVCLRRMRSVKLGFVVLPQGRCGRHADFN